MVFLQYLITKRNNEMLKKLTQGFVILMMLIVLSVTVLPQDGNATPANILAQATKLTQINHPDLPKSPSRTNQTKVPPKNGAGSPGIVYTFKNMPQSKFDAIKFSMRPMTEESNNKLRLAYYWAYQDTFVSTHNNVFYFGLQREGEYGKTALFSAFGDGASFPADSDKYCDPGADNGSGANCHIPYKWFKNRDYDFMVTLDGLTSTQATWKGSVYDHSTKVTTEIGKITLDLNQGQQPAIQSSYSVAFDEYFDWPYHPASEMPFSTILYFTPTGYYQGTPYPGEINWVSLGNPTNTGITFYSDLKTYSYIDQGNP